jgi:hypothetical protein
MNKFGHSCFVTERRNKNDHSILAFFILNVKANFCTVKPDIGLSTNRGENHQNGKREVVSLLYNRLSVTIVLLSSDELVTVQ